MKLRIKTLLLSGIIITILILVLFAISWFVLMNTYSDYENNYSAHILNDELAKFNDSIDAMNQTTSDWAQWDDAYLFVKGDNPGFVNKDLTNNTFTRLDLNLILFVNNNGTIVYGKTYNLQTKQYENTQNLTNITKENLLLDPHHLTGYSGIVNLPQGPMMIVSQPIETSHEEGPSDGTLIMGRYITPQVLSALVNVPNNTLTYVEYNSTNMPADFMNVSHNFSSIHPIITKILGSDSIASYTIINGTNGLPAIILKSDMSRALHQSYLNTVLDFILTLLIVGVLFIPLILFYLDKNILYRLDTIMGEIIDVGKKGDLNKRITVEGDDELSNLSKSINSTLNALQRSEKHLDASEKKYRNIFENTGTSMIMTKENMTISMVNSTFESIMGIPKEDIEGKMNWIEMISPLSPEDVKNYHRTHELDGNGTATFPKTYEVKMKINDTVKDFYTTYDNIPGTTDCLISLIDITDSKKSANQLKTSLKEKELLLREIHHRVKNSLQLISSLLSLQASEIEDETIIERYKESENRIHTISLVHEILYASSDISDINIKDYVEILVDDIVNSYETKNIDIHIDAEDIKLGIETAIPLGLIINELISNSFKYAFKGIENCEIKISIKKHGNAYCLIVHDNGHGLSDDIDVNNPTTLGLQLIQALVTQLEGSIKVEAHDGTAFKIHFKELEYRERI